MAVATRTLVNGTTVAIAKCLSLVSGAISAGATDLKLAFREEGFSVTYMRTDRFEADVAIDKRSYDPFRDDQDKPGDDDKVALLTLTFMPCVEKGVRETLAMVVKSHCLRQAGVNPSGLSQYQATGTADAIAESVNWRESDYDDDGEKTCFSWDLEASEAGARG